MTLDLTGEQPAPDRIREFLKDTDPEKRVKLVASLIASRDFTLFWQIKFGDLLEITTARPDLGNVAFTYQNWLNKRLLANAPWNEIVRELLTSVGDPSDRETGGPAAYALEGLDPKISPRRPPNASSAFASAALNATTTRLMSGPRTITSAWPLPSPRSSDPARWLPACGTGPPSRLSPPGRWSTSGLTSPPSRNC